MLQNKTVAHKMLWSKKEKKKKGSYLINNIWCMQGIAKMINTCKSKGAA